MKIEIAKLIADTAMHAVDNVFSASCGPSADPRLASEDVAHEALRLLLKDARLVTGFIDDGEHFGTDPSPSDTHTALLVNVQPIKRPKVTKADLIHALKYQGFSHHQVLADRIERDGLEGDA